MVQNTYRTCHISNAQKIFLFTEKISYVIMCIRRFLYQSALLKMDGAEKK